MSSARPLTLLAPLSDTERPVFPGAPKSQRRLPPVARGSLEPGTALHADDIAPVVPSYLVSASDIGDHIEGDVASVVPEALVGKLRIDGDGVDVVVAAEIDDV